VERTDAARADESDTHMRMPFRPEGLVGGPPAFYPWIAMRASVCYDIWTFGAYREMRHTSGR
jgi:hypothetical protein